MVSETMETTLMNELNFKWASKKKMWYYGEMSKVVHYTKFIV